MQKTIIERHNMHLESLDSLIKKIILTNIPEIKKQLIAKLALTQTPIALEELISMIKQKSSPRLKIPNHDYSSIESLFAIQSISLTKEKRALHILTSLKIYFPPKLSQDLQTIPFQESIQNSINELKTNF